MTATGLKGRPGSKERHPTGGLSGLLRKPPGRRSGRFLVLSSLVCVLVLVGVVMVLSASSVNDLRLYDDAWHHLKRQMLWLSFGLVALITMMRIDYRSLRKCATPLMIISASLLVLVVVPGVGVRVNGSSRWLSIGPVTFQPSELAKIAVVIYLAELLSRRRPASSIPSFVWRRALLVSGSVGVLLMLEPDLGTNPQLVDSDGNGTPDGEEDADGDRQGNLAEFHLTQTDPLDPNSRFQITINSDPDVAHGALLSFATLPGRSYTISRSNDLVIWTPLFSLPGSGQSETRAVTGTALDPASFFRVEVVQGR